MITLRRVSCCPVPSGLGGTHGCLQTQELVLQSPLFSTLWGWCLCDRVLPAQRAHMLTHAHNAPTLMYVCARAHNTHAYTLHTSCTHMLTHAHNAPHSCIMYAHMRALTHVPTHHTQHVCMCVHCRHASCAHMHIAHVCRCVHTCTHRHALTHHAHSTPAHVRAHTPQVHTQPMCAHVCRHERACVCSYPSPTHVHAHLFKSRLLRIGQHSTPPPPAAPPPSS